MDPRPVTRCGCNARIKVHVDSRNRRWYVDFFSDEHNHDMLEARFRGMIWSYRAIKTRHLHQINTMRSSGLRVPTIFRAFANQSGGFEMVGFQVKDIYNAIEKQRRAGASDTDNALKYLQMLKRRDPCMFWKYSLDEQRRLHNIFWCDGASQYDFNIFRDVMGFDATYGRNKYKCPLVIFSGVDHHMRIVVFGCAVLSKEGEERCVWLLRAFLEAMKGKAPKSVITDDDQAMKSAIKAVFPEAHHRLCSWHLLHNATARVGIPRFMTKFRLCLMGDLEVDDFEDIWNDAVEEFGLQKKIMGQGYV
ncbi:protein FAR1-RELATED SEQUENCE 5-like [Arachis duranensis]|uniref:Protein FAR1-RELATED SEQUENCE 5-like n=1 Tax=Arachis duranensis TaxID=130453 RepID=A0A6P4D3M4_ARADU|nr:protein FAR1-RELATED SEQUENCE 5-like [Arachis duranensis]